jgi:hypothetical protein
MSALVSGNGLPMVSGKVRQANAVASAGNEKIKYGIAPPTLESSSTKGAMIPPTRDDIEHLQSVLRHIHGGNGKRMGTPLRGIAI